MKSVVSATVAFLCMFVVLSVVPVLAQQTPEEFAKESEQACVASASVKPTPQMVVDKVNEAAAILEKEGKAAFPKFKGKDSQFIFAGTYIWIHDEAGNMRMHPIVYKLEGKSIIDLKDHALSAKLAAGAFFGVADDGERFHDVLNVAS